MRCRAERRIDVERASIREIGLRKIGFICWVKKSIDAIWNLWLMGKIRLRLDEFHFKSLKIERKKSSTKWQQRVMCRLIGQ